MTRGTRNIRVSYRTLDHFSEVRWFTTLAGARRYVRRRLGEAFDVSVGFGYAVSGDGIGKVEVAGATWTELLGEGVV